MASLIQGIQGNQINPQNQKFNELFNSIVKTDLTSDRKIGNIFSNQAVNSDYKNALMSKDPNAKSEFIKELLTLDYIGGKNADKRIDGLIDGESIFAIKDGKQKTELVNTYNQTINELSATKAQELNQANNDNNLLNPPDLDSFDLVGNDLRMLVGQLLTQRNYSPEQIKDLNSKGIYTSVSEMTPEMIKNITAGKVKSLQAGNFGGVKLSQAQVGNAEVIAATIVDECKKGNKSPEEIHKAVVIALATAMQESGLKNIGYGDRDSVGLFQQRPSCGWGSKEQCNDPVYATHKFAEKLYQTDYMSKSVSGAAQNVQKSAFPNAYAKWQQMAEALATALLS